MAKLKVVSLFCGMGGADLGIEGGFTYLGKRYRRHNSEVVYANDNDKYAAKLYNDNFRITVDQRDIKEIDANELPKCDIVVGGFPCQSFSIIAQNPPRLGYKEGNGLLFKDMVRILKVLKPKAFIAENVKGLLTANNGNAFPLILDEFKKCGYEVNWKVLSAANFGIPQKRERVFIIGLKKELGLFTNFPTPLFNQKDFVPLKHVIIPEDEIDGKYYFSQKAVSGMLKRREKMNLGRVQDINAACNTINAHQAKVSINGTDPVLKLNGKYRRFTPREAARIQSFPEKYKLQVPEFRQYKAIGNAIPPVLMWYVFNEVSRRIKKV
jgi:DNA (cytosine-5)-methyltransferase 1